jgi:ubiquinone/menaquinone biosynthesis C-methylase UbiE
MVGFLNPNEVLNQLEIKEDMIAADFGSGSGGWAIPLAKRLKKGKVYAIDVQEEMLSALKGKAEIENIFNIELKKADLEKGSEIKENILDLVLITNLLFQVKNKEGIIAEAKRVLKRGGEILIVDWREDSSLGPKEGRVSPKNVKEIAKKQGFTLKKEFKAGIYHWGLIFTKE